MTINISNLMPFLFIPLLLCSVFVLCICAVAQSAISQLVRTVESFFAVFDSQSGQTPATPRN
jgi:hypothetical protein